MPEATWVPGIPEWETSVPVELVRVATRDGFGLAGMLRKPKDEGCRLGVDLILLMHGSGGNFYGAGMFNQYSHALLEEGCAVLRVNNRGHDLVSVSGGRRFGHAYESIDDCRYDWEAWIDFAEAAGYQRIGLWGHSRGALKSIYYMSVQHDPRVKCVVAASPPRFSFDDYIAMKEGEEFKQDYARARQLIDERKLGGLINVDVPLPGQLITAERWMEKYGPDAKYDYLDHIPNVRVPLLVTIGSPEEEGPIALAFRGMPRLLEKLAGELEHLTFELIPGADHGYSSQRQYLWEVVSRWLKAIMGLSADTRSGEFPEYKLTSEQLARLVGTYGDPPRIFMGPSGEPVTGIRVYLRDGALYWDRQGPSGEIHTSAARFCAEDAILVGEGDGQRRQFLKDRNGAVWALIVGPYILRKLE